MIGPAVTSLLRRESTCRLRPSRARAEQLEIASFGENDFVHGLRLIDGKDSVANRARNNLAVRQLKLDILLTPLHPDRLQYRGVDPRGLSARVDHQVPYGSRLKSHWI